MEVFFPVDHDLGDGLSVDFDAAVVGYLCAWELLDQFLEHGTLGHSVGIGIEDDGVGLHLYLCNLGRHLGFLQHLAVLLEHDFAEVDALVLLGERDVAEISLVAYEADAQDVVASLDARELKLAFEVGGDACRLCAVLGLQQHDSRAGHGLGERAVLDKSAHCDLLRHGRERAEEKD